MNKRDYRRPGTVEVGAASGEVEGSYLDCLTLKIARIVRETARSERFDASWIESSCASGSLRSRRRSGMICTHTAAERDAPEG